MDDRERTGSATPKAKIWPLAIIGRTAAVSVNPKRHFAGRDRCRCRRAAAIGHGLHGQPKLALQQLAREIGRRAATGDAVAQRLGLRGFNEVGNRRDSRLGIGGQDERATDDFADRHQIGERIVVDPSQMDVDRDRTIREDDERVTVRLASHQIVDADGRIRARLVFHDDALSDSVLQVFCDHARGQIDAAAGRVGHDNSDAPARECFCMRRYGDRDPATRRAPAMMKWPIPPPPSFPARLRRADPDRIQAHRYPDMQSAASLIVDLVGRHPPDHAGILVDEDVDIWQPT